MQQNVLGNNERIMMQLNLADQRGDMAQSNPHLRNIQSYYNMLLRIYLNVKGDFYDEDVRLAEQLKNRYDNIIGIVQTDSRAQTMKAINDLLMTCLELNCVIVNGLRNIKFFGSIKEVKHIRLFEGKKWDSKTSLKVQEII